jgi:lincosamide nucleotidyltransferase A/C/D/E
MDSLGTEIPTAFVLQDSEGREVDAHAMRLDDQGNGIPAWADDRGVVFTKDDLAGEGLIAGFAVRCLSPEMQVLCHTGYDLPNVQVRDLDLLHERFGVKYPDESKRTLLEQHLGRAQRE